MGMLRTWSICVGGCVLDEIVSGTEGHLSLSVHTQTLVATSVTLTLELLCLQHTALMSSAGG